ncbi:nucleic acid/nucleotide deaminase domain-containing protein [Streptomyces griseofuscus]|uniref:nucleic acid/nucleotide deaminase domain-containing protein n=1 Tax=Streptomyces griseofuscus TaxID=146922 RepID=UPI0034538CD3
MSLDATSGHNGLRCRIQPGRRLRGRLLPLHRRRAQATVGGCPKPAWQFLQRSTLKNVKIENWQHHFSGKDIVRAGWQSLFGDVTKAVKALDAAARTGIDFEDAYKALRGLDGLSPLAKEGIGAGFALSANNACEGMIPYAGSELAVVAYKFRVASGLRYKFGRNIAVARVPGWAAAAGAKDDFVVFANISRGLHSEELIIQKLEENGFNKNQISELYSERSSRRVLYGGTLARHVRARKVRPLQSTAPV